MMTWCAQHSLNHRNNAGAVEQFLLLRTLLENSGKCKSFYRTFPLVLCWRLDSDVRRVSAFALFNSEEARICRVRGSQAQENVKKRTRRSRWRFHSCVVKLGSKCRLGGSMRWYPESVGSSSRVQVNTSRVSLSGATTMSALRRNASFYIAYRCYIQHS